MNKESCKLLRLIELIIDYLATKHLWSHLCANTINKLKLLWP